MKSEDAIIRDCIARCSQPGRDGRWRHHRVRECANKLRADGTSPLIAAATARACAEVGARNAAMASIADAWLASFRGGA